ncbi:hypothetical protein [Okeania sp. KiyG1]|uniref:hypothetical protein n=1 Tax=Okeania sp. KiyG1 TaxID=2720165 RepID=UPI0019229274|nr:hypothetical protein [Okeania sp. KiyG1]
MCQLQAKIKFKPQIIPRIISLILIWLSAFSIQLGSKLLTVRTLYNDRKKLHQLQAKIKFKPQIIPRIISLILIWLSAFSIQHSAFSIQL